MRGPLDIHPVCRFCPDPATRWRLPGNPPWGLDAKHQEIQEQVALRLWALDGVPDNAYGTCDEHLEARLDDQGNLVLSARGKQARARAERSKPKLSRAEVSRRHRAFVRDQLLMALGGKCGECGEMDPVLLRAHWPHPRRPIETDGLNALQWYQWLLLPEHADKLNKMSLRCVSHAPSPTSRSALRDTVLQEYGEKCVRCGTTDRLWIVPRSGTTVPRYPSGKKYGSTDKYRWLIQQGFPSGWDLMCPEHALKI